MENIQKAFSSSGEFYDLFYNDKAYNEEADYFISLLKKYTPSAETLLELGSGSGNFSMLFSQAGYKVTGVEISEGMMQRAIQKNIPSFLPLQGNISSFNVGKKFDVAVSLFDVICYLNDTNEIRSCFERVHQHLRAGGYFIFDTWHTAGVYAHLPEVRTKQVEDSTTHVVRKAVPVVHFDTNTVDVNYEFLITDKNSNITHPLYEKHTLRHFSIVEIADLAFQTGFEHIRSEELLTANNPSQKSWKVCHILKQK